MKKISIKKLDAIEGKTYFDEFIRSKIFIKNEFADAFINIGLKEFPFKRNYSWYLIINISTKYIFTDYKKIRNEIIIQNRIENKLKILIKGYCKIKSLIKLLYKDRIELHWYLSCPEIDYKTGKHIIDEIKQIRDITFNIDEDPNWEQINKFFKDVG